MTTEAANTDRPSEQVVLYIAPEVDLHNGALAADAVVADRCGSPRRPQDVPRYPVVAIEATGAVKARRRSAQGSCVSDAGAWMVDGLRPDDPGGVAQLVEQLVGQLLEALVAWTRRLGQGS